MNKTSSFLVSPDWLANHLGDPDIAIVDASWYLPAMNRNGKDEYETRHIPGAVFFDIDAVSQPESDLPHTLASPEIFASEVGKLGITNEQTIVVYDGAGLFSAARVWWNFRIMGATEVFILDGGLPAWLEEGFPTETGIYTPDPKQFVASFDKSAVVSFDAMQKLVAGQSSQIADARPPGRFTGEEAEPRAGMRSGHMPRATSLPATTLSQNGKLLPLHRLEEILSKAGISKDEPVVTTCGSGVTAAIISLALESTGHSQHRLYDGSWSEWGGRDDTEIVTGE